MADRVVYINEAGGLEDRGIVDGKIVTHAADIAAHQYSLMLKVRTGEYFHGVPVYSETLNALVADQIYAVPFIVERALTIDRLAIEVTTGDAGKIARLGIYNDGANMYPGTLVQDYGTVSVAAAAVVAASADQALTPGLYWLVVVSDGVPTLSWHSYISFGLGQTATTFDVPGRVWMGWYKGAVGSGALADPFVAAGTLQRQSMPAVLPRLKTLD